MKKLLIGIALLSTFSSYASEAVNFKTQEYLNAIDSKDSLMISSIAKRIEVVALTDQEIQIILKEITNRIDRVRKGNESMSFDQQDALSDDLIDLSIIIINDELSTIARKLAKVVSEIN